MPLKEHSRSSSASIVAERRLVLSRSQPKGGYGSTIATSIIREPRTDDPSVSMHQISWREELSEHTKGLLSSLKEPRQNTMSMVSPTLPFTRRPFLRRPIREAIVTTPLTCMPIQTPMMLSSVFRSIRSSSSSRAQHEGISSSSPPKGRNSRLSMPTMTTTTSTSISVGSCGIWLAVLQLNSSMRDMTTCFLRVHQPIWEAE